MFHSRDKEIIVFIKQESAGEGYICMDGKFQCQPNSPAILIGFLPLEGPGQKSCPPSITDTCA